MNNWFIENLVAEKTINDLEKLVFRSRNNMLTQWRKNFLTYFHLLIISTIQTQFESDTS